MDHGWYYSPDHVLVSFTARRRTIMRIGLPQVRNHRLSLLAQEELNVRKQLDRRMQVYPEMAPLILIRVEGNSHEQLA